ncbi:transglutaminase family protein [Megalodesulfovibrio gigas]|uniref:Putative transglutaminase domain protein n=1 Tax=Megalodesulfovibrio gigas (strain ATCC 19364 / DSM 1382 / NCIMB 9332 / VKM B-1759) TaxID=1121448 RepID=T2G7K8_MEGG1|nr:transglutaminase family protein [Megalodesulfovibrio gigas]AGW12111.1 putative transglutaminase domain protein [Megalodesulfovibrio gigas DSM 1382 = ATCC 19364]
MRLAIEHRTVYRFSGPVFLEPHTVRLTPRGDPAQRLEAFSLGVLPAAQAMSHHLDALGNAVHRCWFLDMTAMLEIHTTCVVETLRANPFDFLPESPDQPGQPADSSATQALAPALVRAFREPEDVAAVSMLAREAGGQAAQDALGFCTRLCGLLHQRIETVTRRESGVLGPAAVLAAGGAACRDMALVFMDCCRTQGLPARFVSGYQHPAIDTDADGADSERDLHAWAEVYVPGGGWRGFDPTHGLLVADRHVAVAAAPCWEDTMPVTGSFRGTGAAAVLEHAVEIRELEPAAGTEPGGTLFTR